MKKTNFFLNWNLIEKLKINMVYVRNWLWSKSLLKYVLIVQNYTLKYLPKLQLGLFVLYVSLFFIGIVCKIIPTIRFMLRKKYNTNQSSIKIIIAFVFERIN